MPWIISLAFIAIVAGINFRPRRSQRSSVCRPDESRHLANSLDWPRPGSMAQYFST
jgi:hypothetical protein